MPSKLGWAVVDPSRRVKGIIKPRAWFFDELEDAEDYGIGKPKRARLTWISRGKGNRRAKEGNK